MPSKPLTHWQNESRQKLDEFENAHLAVSGGQKKPGRRYLTEQLNHAYLVAVAAQFQKFCRDLHTEATHHLMNTIANRGVQQVCLSVMTQGRELDNRNATSGTITKDFKRLGIVKIFDEANQFDPLNEARKKKLDQMITWRNAIGHQDFAFSPQEQAEIQGTMVTLVWVRKWRKNIGQLAECLDEVVGAHVGRVVGTRPW